MKEGAGIKPLTLRLNFSWTLLGSVIFTACQGAMLVILAKLGTAEMVGQFALGLAMSAPIFMFSNLQLRGLQASDARGEYQFSDYLGLRLIMTIAALTLVVIIDYIAVNEMTTFLVVLAVGISKAVESVSDIFFGLMQQKERMDRIAISMIIKGSISLLAFGIFIYMTDSVFWGVTGLTIMWALVLLFYDIPNGKKVLSIGSKGNETDDVFSPPGTRIGIIPNYQMFGKHNSNLQPRFTILVLKSLFLSALPLGMVMMLISLNTNIPRYFIQHYCDESALGIFAAMAYLMVAGSLVTNALGQSAYARLGQYFVTRESKAFLKLLYKMIAVAVIIGALGIIFVITIGRQTLTILYTPEYAENMDVFLILMVAAAVGYVGSMFGYAATAIRRLKQQPVALALVIVITTVSCWFLVPSLGLLGASLSLLIGAGTNALSFALILFMAEASNKYSSHYSDD